LNASRASRHSGEGQRCIAAARAGHEVMECVS
jgi:hypothetical protein